VSRATGLALRAITTSVATPGSMASTRRAPRIVAPLPHQPAAQAEADHVDGQACCQQASAS
jgi:hypothetical protein